MRVHRKDPKSLIPLPFHVRRLYSADKPASAEPFFSMFNPREGMGSLEQFEFYFSISRNLLDFGGLVKIMGILPDRIWVSRLMLVLTLIATNFIIIPQCYATINRPATVTKILEVAGSNLVLFNVGLKSAILMYQRDTVIKQEESWKNLWKETVSSEELSLLGSYAKKGKALTYCWLFTSLIAGSAYLIAPLIISLRNNFVNGTELPFPIGIEIESNVTLICVYAAQIFSIIIIYVAVTGVDLIGPVLVIHACGHLKVLQLKLSNIGKDCIMPMKSFTPSNANGMISSERNASTIHNSVASDLKDCIRRHQAILNACAELERSLNLLGLIEALCAVWHICLAGVGLIVVPEETPKFLLHLGSALYHLFIYCWPSDNLITESLEVANSAFGIPWYLFPSNVQIDALMMIERARKSCRYTAGGYFALSLEAYTALLSKGFSTFAVLRTVM